MNTCKTCGGPVNRVGNYYICEYCRNKWEIDSGNDIHAVERANAWAALRDGDFEKASQLFEEIILKDGNSHEGYWGRALALGGIVYVTDLNENKKVPTCNNITEDSFIKHKDVQKAISIAPADIAAGYQEQAEYIEKVRLEWLQKASKEPAYDVFISFKDSDRENGIERTQDSIDAQDLYNALVAEGYKVFFSRISLRDKIAEQYEPYIYNAIKTAKVMIVFGEKAAYFSSVWIKNEWSRFKTRIEKGEKHKNSLVVVYKNMNPGDLPVVLRARQCLNAADMTFLSDLNRHIKRVIEESRQTVHIEKIKIEGGRVAKKATTLSARAVQTREVGQGAIAETSVDEKQSLNLIETYIKANQWDRAKSLSEDVLFNNPTCAEAIWYSMLADRKEKDIPGFIDSLRTYSGSAIYSLIEKLLDCASKPLANQLLETFYRQAPNLPDSVCAMLLKTILPYKFDSREICVAAAFKNVIANTQSKAFNVLLTTLEESQVDEYVNYHIKFAKAAKDLSLAKQYLQKVLAVNEGKLEALRQLAKIEMLIGSNPKQMAASFEKLLAFSRNQDKEVEGMLQLITTESNRASQYEFTLALLQYYSKDIATITSQLTVVAKRAIHDKLFDLAEQLLRIVLTKEQGNADVLWMLCMIKMNAATESDIEHSTVLLTNIPEYKKYLTLVSEQRRLECIELEKQQHCYRNKAKKEWKDEIEELEIGIMARNSMISRRADSDESKGYKKAGAFLCILGMISLILGFIISDEAISFGVIIFGVFLSIFGIVTFCKAHAMKGKIYKEQAAIRAEIAKLENELKELKEQEPFK